MSWELTTGGSPERWERTQLRTLLTRSRAAGRPDLPLLSVNLPEGVVMRKENDGRPAPAQDLSSYQVVRKNDLVMNQLGKPHGALGISDFDGIISPAYFVAKVDRDRAVPRFIHYLLRTRKYISEYERRGKFMPPSQFDISWDQFRSVPLALPTVAEQQAIADFLDTEIARIDALITKKRRMIDLLRLRSVAGVDRMVLGTDADQLCQSRTGYFQGIPRHWMETAARHLGCVVQTGPFGSQLHAEDYVDGGWPVVNPANLQGGGIVPIESMAVSDSKRLELARHILQPGDIVFGRRGEMGRAGLVTEAQDGWLCGTGSLRLRLAPNSPLEPQYLKVLLETTALRRYFELASIGSTMDNLNSGIVLGMPCVVPPADEQAAIVAKVERIRREEHELTSRLHAQLGLLSEHRQALITAAVTGELEVPGVAA